MSSRPATRDVPGERTIIFRQGAPSENLRRYLHLRNSFEFGFTRALKRLDEPAACRRGCTWCCTHDAPSITPYEAAALIELILGREDLTDVLDRARSIRDRAQVLAARGGRNAEALPCPFLEGGGCRIYRERPMGCVWAVSRDRQVCAEAALAGREAPWTLPPGRRQEVLETLVQVMPWEDVVALGAQHEVVEAEGTLPLPVALAVLAEGLSENGVGR